MRGKDWLGLLIIGAALLTAAPGRAQTNVLRVTVDKAAAVNLDASSTIVLIANPEIADVIVERNRLLFVLGKHPGETSLFVYNDNGQRILERAVVVVPQDHQVVTVTRETTSSEYSCQPRCVLKTPGAGGAPGGAAPASAPAAALASPVAAPIIGAAPVPLLAAPGAP